MMRSSPPAVAQRPTAVAVPSPTTSAGFSADRGALSARSEGSQSSRLSGVRCALPLAAGQLSVWLCATWLQKA
jgi:hypothetical protein